VASARTLDAILPEISIRTFEREFSLDVTSKGDTMAIIQVVLYDKELPIEGLI
jgi:hypothetical protein